MLTQQQPSLRRAALVLRALLLTLFMLVAGAAQAQLLDDLEVRRDAADAVVLVRFTKPIRLQRALSPRDGELTVVQYEVVSAGDAVVQEPPSEKRLKGSGGLPDVVVTDEPAGTARMTERKLVFRVMPAAKVRARVGRDGRTFEMVLVGLGARVGPALPITAPMAASTASPQPQGYQILLHSSPDPMMQLPASVPREVQDYSLDTGKRVINGVTNYEFYLGPFATLNEATKVLDRVKGRFAQASVMKIGASDATSPADGAAVGKIAAPAAPVSAATAAAAAAANAAAAAAAAAAATAPTAAVDVTAAAASAMALARQAQAKGDVPAAVDALGKVLDLPPNPSSREAQARIGEMWLKSGDVQRARREFELFLKLYPSGLYTDQVTAQLQALPSEAAVAARPERSVPTTTTANGSVGVYYYGGQSKIRSEDFKDSAIGGLPELVQNPTLSGTDQRLLATNVDLSYRNRTGESDLRGVFRDNFQANLLPGKADRNRLSAAYVDYRSLTNGMGVRLGRQSPTGSGVFSRFDGVAANWTFQPKWKANVVAGVPTERLQQTRRYFYGASLDADALTENLGGTVYLNEQKIDGQTDRRGVGLDSRYFKEGIFVSTNFDYDVKLRALNIAALQGTWQNIDADGNAGTTVNVMLDRRAQPLLSLGNALFFQDPNGGLVPLRLSDALALRSIETLREYVRTTTAYSTQGVLGVTTPLNKQWQVGGDIRLTKVDAIAPVPVILPDGQAATGNIWGYGAQLIGTNLYSERDTHVISASLQRAPTFSGVLVMYNNLTAVSEGWQLEPSLQFYRQTATDGLRLNRWKPGLRLAWRVVTSAVLETSVDYEISTITSPLRNEKTNRLFYYFGGRYEF